MSDQAEVHSIEALKDFRAVLALYSEDTLAALGAVEAEIRRTAQWLHQERPYYWQEQIKRRREAVASAKSEVFRRKLQKKPDYSPSMSEPMEILRRAEASLADAEKRLTLVRKWQTLFNQAVLEYHGGVQRIKDLAASDLPRAVGALVRIIDALEAYLQVRPPAGLGPAFSTSEGSSAKTSAPAEFETIASQVLDAEPFPEPTPPDRSAAAADAVANADTITNTNMGTDADPNPDPVGAPGLPPPFGE